ncbi:MAG: DUF454 domain-containing protein [Gammaproteobacteria bacterium]|nr:DUF454 domain-containing protein [Gammaproteobacteria bacterium]
MSTLLWRILGFASVGIGVINAFIPLMPTTVFLLVGAWALGKGSPEWRTRLVNHPRFGRALRDWEDGRRVSRRGKRLAALGMAVSWTVLVVWRGFTPWSIGTGVLLVGIASWLWRRPEPRKSSE